MVSGQRLGRRVLGGCAAACVVGGALAASGCAGVSAVAAQKAHPHVVTSSAAPARLSAPAEPPLAGKVVGVDPGHNGGNFTHPAQIGQQIWNGREWESCNTTGTESDGGYTEALFNYRVASDLRADLVAAGARVVITRGSNNGVGPCVDKRAALINAAHADVGIAIHADGASPSGQGFAILVPVADGPNDKVIGSSLSFAQDLRSALLAGTPMPVSNYDGTDGIQPRDNLAGLNLTRVPMVLVEVGNMRNSTDAQLQTSSAFQQQVAEAILAAIIKFLG